MRTIMAVLVVASLCAACSDSDDALPAPAVDASTAAVLQARAIQRACQDVLCAGAPIYAPDSTPDEVRQAILAQYTDEVKYLSESEIVQRTSADGRFAGGATMIGVRGVLNTERDDVKGVNVWISKGSRDFNGRTYLFVWNGSEWADTSPDAVSVTVTSSVS
jgi:hypothetical protein